MANVVAATSFAFITSVATSFAFITNAATSTFIACTIIVTTFAFTIGIVAIVTPTPFITTCTFSLSGVSYEQYWNNQNTHNF